MPSIKVQVKIYDDEAEDGERTIEVPGVREVCGRCHGDGTHWHPAFSNGITQQEREEDWDDDSWDGLMSGQYNVVCEECGGRNVVDIVDEEAFAEQMPDDYSLWAEQERDRWECDEISRMERMMGA